MVLGHLHTNNDYSYDFRTVRQHYSGMHSLQISGLTLGGGKMDMTCPRCSMTAICDDEIEKGRCRYCGAGVIFTPTTPKEAIGQVVPVKLKANIDLRKALLLILLAYISGMAAGLFICNGLIH